MNARVAFGALGVVVMAVGAYRLATEVPLDQLPRVGAWALGAVAVHDAVLAPAALVLGWLSSRAVPEPARAPLRAGLLVLASLVVVAVPLLRSTSPAANASVVPGDPARSLLVLVALTVLTSVAVAVLRVLQAQRAQRVLSRGGWR